MDTDITMDTDIKKLSINSNDNSPVSSPKSSDLNNNGDNYEIDCDIDCDVDDLELSQSKLSKSEWNNVEIPENDKEIEILELIKKGYHDVNIKYNNTKSIGSILKITYSPELMLFLFEKYFKTEIDNEIIIKHKFNYDYETGKARSKKRDEKEKKEKKEIKIKKTDEIRIANTTFQINRNNVYEYILIDIIKNLVNNYVEDNTRWMYYYYSLKIMLNNDIDDLNIYIVKLVDYIINYFEEELNIEEFLENAYEYIEKNEYLFKYRDEKLYEHQKQIFTICKKPQSKLILYIAPTGTGKTLTPIGLSEKHRVIFVCAARHVGLALAKAAISSKKKIAFAFGCNSVDNIRLHYYAVKEAIRDKNGRIRKVDNSIGDEVEIMICDIKSYIHAMYYMKAFNDVKDIILYWDEPTITMDYDNHEFHNIIKRNWTLNEIPNVIFSSATLPHYNELTNTINDFKIKFPDASIESIVSHDCSKSIPIVNKDGYIDLPHFLFKSYDDILISVKHCEQYKTLLRYFDLNEIIKFITYINSNEYYTSTRYSISRFFCDISDITMIKLKEYYLILLKNIKPELWDSIYKSITSNRTKVYDSTIYFTTSDAHTLTDGPTIFLTNDVEKIAKFAIQTAKIPEQVIKEIMNVIQHNNSLTKKIEELEKVIEDIIQKNTSSNNDDPKKRTKKEERVLDMGETREKMRILEALRYAVKNVSLNDIFIPNKLEHIKQWTNKKSITNEFTCNVDNNSVEKIMLCPVEDHWKILLLMGIGAITNTNDVKYNEIVKDLAQNQKLFLIIASSDYIYGTNYQFCHGYISKDLGNITQEKAIQAMGRVGRNKIQQSYTIRFRDDNIISKLFIPSEFKPEVVNMNRLFNSQ